MFMEIAVRRTIKAVLIATLPAAGAASAAPSDMSPQLRVKAQQTVDAGVKFPVTKQAANGSVLNSAGLTAL